MQTERDALVHRLRQIDEQLVQVSDERRAIVDALAELREQLYPPVPWAKGRRPPDVDRSPLPPATEGSQAISGRDLRITCLTILRRHGTLCLPELHGLLHRYGYLIAATRPVTALSDAMAYEVEHGRARRVERGVYRATDRPDPTRRTAPPLEAFPSGPPPIDGPSPLDPDLDEDPGTWSTTDPQIPSDPEAVTNLRPWSLLISPPRRTSSSWLGRSSTRAPRPSRRGAARTSTRCSPTTSPTPAPPSRRPDRCSTTAPSATSKPQITCAFVADAVGELASRLFGREATWGIDAAALDGARSFCATYRDPAFLAGLAGQEGRRNLDDDFELVQDTFRRFADEKLTPIAEHIHRHNEDIPEDIISGPRRDGRLRALHPRGVRRLRRAAASPSTSAWSSPPRSCPGGRSARAGRLITRPEILTRALVKGGTEEQKQQWLPQLATAEVMNAVAVTEPDFGSRRRPA